MSDFRVVGCGDLGGSLINEGLQQGGCVSFYDTNPESVDFFMRRFTATVDPTVQISPDLHDSTRLSQCGDGLELAERPGPLHFAIPAQAVLDFAGVKLPDGGFMHDSVMTSSRVIWELIDERGGDTHNLSVVHFLMNDARKVILDPAYGDVEQAERHLQDLHMDVRYLEADEHDAMMSETQGAMLKLMLDYALKLRLLNQGGLLRGPGPLTDLNKVLAGRFATWTDETIRSVADNPHLDIAPGDVEEFLRNRAYIKSLREAGYMPDMVNLLGIEPTMLERLHLTQSFSDFCIANNEKLKGYATEGLLTPSGTAVQQLVERSMVLVG